MFQLAPKTSSKYDRRSLSATQFSDKRIQNGSQAKKIDAYLYD